MDETCHSAWRLQGRAFHEGTEHPGALFGIRPTCRQKALRARSGLGGFAVRFPHPDDPGDTGWHVDVSFPGDNCDPNEQSDFSS
jgi:hypothetical protein